MTRRRTIDVPGLHHTNPIPVASSIGNLLMSGGIAGQDPRTGQYGRDLESQCSLMFQNVRLVMEAAGSTTDRVIKVNVWLRDIADKKPLNDEWCRMFPDEESRPARHTFGNPELPPGQLVQCEIIAVLD